MGIRATTVNPEVGHPDLHRRSVVNSSGVDIAQGEILYISGSTLPSDNLVSLAPLPTVAKADADASSTGGGKLLIALHPIKAGAKGTATEWMWFRMDTSSMAVGADLYLSGTAGAVSTTPGTVSRRVGRVMQQDANGLVLLDVTASDVGAAASSGVVFGTTAPSEVGETALLASPFAWDDTSPVEGWAVTSGQIWVAHWTVYVPGVAWNGTGADADLGTIVPSVANSLFDGSADFVDLTDTFESGISGSKDVLLNALAETVTTKVTITPGSGASAGSGTFYTLVTRVA